MNKAQETRALPLSDCLIPGGYHVFAVSDQMRMSVLKEKQSHPPSEFGAGLEGLGKAELSEL